MVSDADVKSEASEKKRGRPRRVESDYDIQLAAEMLSNKGMAENKRPKYKKSSSPSDDMFSMSRLQEDFKDILPKLDEDFAKLEANLINDELDFEELLNFDGIDGIDGIDNDFDENMEQLSSGGGKGALDNNIKKKMRSVQDLDATLRSIESGSYSIDDLLNLDEAMGADLESVSRSTKGAGSRNKKGSLKKSLSSNVAEDDVGSMRGTLDEDDDDDESILDDSSNDDVDDGSLSNTDPLLSRRRKNSNDEDEDLMIDVINMSKSGVDDEDEDEEEETIAPRKRGRPAKANIDKPMLSLDDINAEKRDFTLDPPPLGTCILLCCIHPLLFHSIYRGIQATYGVSRPRFDVC